MYTIVIAVVVGVLIGALTNALAIKMLFRPFTEWRVGSFRVPFTPGLIPKRRDELAEQLGVLVEKYLFTASGVKQFLEKSNIKEQLLSRIREKFVELESKETTIQEVLTSLLKGEDWKNHIYDLSEKRMNEIYSNKKEMSLEQLLSREVHEVVERKLELLTPKILEGLKKYFDSNQGKEQINHALKDFLDGKKMLGFLAGFLLEGNQFQDKITEYIGQLLDKPSSKEMINNLILQEWSHLKVKPLSLLLNEIDEMLLQQLSEMLKNGVDRVGEIKLSQLIQYIEQKNWLEKGYHLILELVLSRVDRLFGYFPIAKIVKIEVSQFSLVELEKMIISVVNKELKMITYFGGLLGGIIGLLQGLLYFFS